ncbi:hypothetical protein Trydic_g8509 [Trypoxylus dichotomus]
MCIFNKWIHERDIHQFGIILESPSVKIRMLILPPNDIFSITSDTEQAPSSELTQVKTSSGKRISEKLKKAIDNSLIQVIALDFQPLSIIEDDFISFCNMKLNL